MSQKVKIIIILSAVVLIVGGIVLYDKKLRNSDANYIKTITIGVVDFPGYAGLYLAKQQGFFEKAGLKVELKKYSSLMDQNRDFIDGYLDITANTSVEVVSQALLGNDQRTVLLLDSSKGADGILANKTISSPAGLMKKKVAYEFGTLEEYVLASALEPSGLSLKDIESVNATPEDSVRLLKDGQVDAAVSYEPFLSQGLSSNSKAHLIWSTKNHPELIYDLLVFQPDFLKNYPQTTKKLVKSYFEAIEYGNTNPNAFASAISQELTVPLEEAQAQLESIQIFNLQANKAKFAPGFNSGSIYNALSQALNFYQTHINNSYRINTDSLVDPTIILSLP